MPHDPRQCWHKAEQLPKREECINGLGKAVSQEFYDKILVPEHASIRKTMRQRLSARAAVEAAPEELEYFDTFGAYDEDETVDALHALAANAEQGNDGAQERADLGAKTRSTCNH